MSKYIKPERVYRRYTINAYNQMTPDGLTLLENCKVTVFANTEDEAVEKAKTFVTRNHYLCNEATEFVYDLQIDG
jgi:hypothetical protein